jgi:hypothetical protein
MLKELWAENYWPSPVCSREADFDTNCSAASVLPVGKDLSEAVPAVAPTQCADVVESVADNLALIDSGATQPVVRDLADNLALIDSGATLPVVRDQDTVRVATSRYISKKPLNKQKRTCA